MRPLRYALRLPWLLVHVLLFLPMVLLLISLPTRRLRLPAGEPLEYRLIRWWQDGLMRVFGFRMRRRGTPLPGPTTRRRQFTKRLTTPLRA